MWKKNAEEGKAPQQADLPANAVVNATEPSVVQTTQADAVQSKSQAQAGDLSAQEELVEIEDTAITAAPVDGDRNSLPQEDIQSAMQANNEGVAFKKNNELGKALASYNRAIQLYSQYAIAYYNRALLYAAQGILDKALSDYTKAIEISPRDSEFYSNRGNIYVRQNRFDQALEDYHHALSLLPNNSEGYHNRAQLYMKLNQPELSLEDFKRAIALNPDLVVDYFNLACLCTLQGETDSAFDFLEKAFRKGYKNIQQVQTDPDLEKLRENPAFQDLIEMWSGNQQ